jgi:hypothetical protein
MKTLTASLMLMLAIAGAAGAQELRQEDRDLKRQIESSYDVVPLTDAVGLRPKQANDEVRLIEIADVISINGTVVTGRELRERVGDNADAILKLSYLAPEVRRALFEPPPAAPEPAPAPAATPEPRQPRSDRRPAHRGGDRVRIFGDVTVREDEHIAGQVVAVLGSVRIEGEVGDQVVAVLGSVDLGEKAVVHGDVVSVGGRVRRAAGAQVRGAVTDVAFADPRWQNRIGPFVGGLGLLSLVDGFGAVPRLIGTTFRLLLLLLFASVAMILARPLVEGSAQRISDQPVKATIIGLIAELMFIPVLVLTCIVLSLSIVGIPLLLLVPFAVLFVLLLAVVGFTGAALAVGQWARRRFGLASPSGFADIWLGILIVLLPVLVGRLVGLGGFLGGPVALLLVAAGLTIEFLVWATGFGAVLSNAFGRWQARRAMRTAPATIP